jgi:hypothetical protein
LPIDEAALVKAESELTAVLEVYEVILGTQKFVCGDVSITLPNMTDERV